MPADKITSIIADMINIIIADTINMPLAILRVLSSVRKCMNKADLYSILPRQGSADSYVLHRLSKVTS
eukprot:scaffold294555_cov53-Prasinocladus_malaysianus.AAC.1